MHRTPVPPLAMCADDIGNRSAGDRILARMLDNTINWETCPSFTVAELEALLQLL